MVFTTLYRLVKGPNAVLTILYRLVMGPSVVCINLYYVVIGVTSGVQGGGGSAHPLFFLCKNFLAIDLRGTNKAMELFSRRLIRWCKDGQNKKKPQLPPLSYVT